MKKWLIGLATYVSCSHIFLSVFKYFDYNYRFLLEFIENITMDVLVLLAIAYAYKNRADKSIVKKYFSVEQLLLSSVFLFLLISSGISALKYGWDDFASNKVYLDDLFVCAFIIFPWGKHLVKATNKMKSVLRCLTDLSLLGISGVMVWILIAAFRSEVLSTFFGSAIGMLEFNGTLQLSINCHPNTVGAYAGLILCICIYFFANSRGIRRYVYFVECLIHFLVLALSNSRGSFFAFICIAAVMTGLTIYYLLAKADLKKRWIAACIGAVAVVAVLIFARNSIFAIYDSVKQTNSVVDVEQYEEVIRDLNITSFTGRPIIWKGALKIIFGGVSEFLFGITPYHIAGEIQRLINSEIGFYTHNQILEVASDVGVPACILFLVFLWRLAVVCYKKGTALSEGDQWKKKFLPIIILFLVIANVMEATLLFYGYLSGCVFMLLSGMIIERNDASERVKG